jgi:hypothetical protein
MCGIIVVYVSLEFTVIYKLVTSFSRMNTFAIHSLSTSKSVIRLIIDDIKYYYIFGTIVPLLNVKPNWKKVIYLSFILAIPSVSSMQHSLINLKKNKKDERLKTTTSHGYKVYV